MLKRVLSTLSYIALGTTLADTLNQHTFFREMYGFQGMRNELKNYWIYKYIIIVTPVL